MVFWRGRIASRRRNLGSACRGVGFVRENNAESTRRTIDQQLTARGCEQSEGGDNADGNFGIYPTHRIYPAPDADCLITTRPADNLLNGPSPVLLRTIFSDFLGRGDWTLVE
jgi:hypothetical protein